MKLQLNEDTLNAYINEAIRQELNEGLGSLGKLFGFAGKAAGTATKQAGKNGARVITHSPILKKFFGNIKDAKSARKFITSLRRGKPVEGTLETGGKQWRAVAQKGWKPGMKSQNVEFFVKDPATQKWVKATGKDLPLVKQSFSHHLTNASNLLNSAQRNMLGTSLAAGLGTGWAIDHAKHSSRPDDPWNEPIDQDNNGQGNDETDGNDGGFDGTFPWDNTTPNWTPRRPKTPAPAAEGTPAEPERPKTPEWAYQPVSTINGQTGVTGTGETQQGLKQHPENYVDSAKRVMLQTASAGLAGNTGNPKLDNWKQTNRNTRRTANDAIDTMRRDGAITRNQARQDKRALKDTEKMIRRNAKDMQNNY